MLPSKVYTLVCEHCGTTYEGKRSWGKFCSAKCGDDHRNGLRFPKTTSRICKTCGEEFMLETGDNNRRYCSKECSKKGQSKRVRIFNEKNPDAMKGYNKNRLAKNPDAWRDKNRRERAEALKLLGGKCIVCGVDNPHWLHLDYIPTSIGMRYRHSRSLKFIRENLSDFRILCANHHYELTLTGKIEGTDIIQKTRSDYEEERTR